MIVIPMVIVFLIHSFYLFTFKKYSRLMLPILVYGGRKPRLAEWWIRRQGFSLLSYALLDVLNLTMVTILFFFGNLTIRVGVAFALLLSGTILILSEKGRGYLKIMLFIYLIYVLFLSVFIFLKYLKVF